MLTYLLTKDGLMFLDENSRPVHVPKDHPDYQTMCLLLEQGKATSATLMRLVQMEKTMKLRRTESLNKKFSSQLQTRQGALVYNNTETLPESLAELLLKTVEMGEDPQALVRCIEYIMMNPLVRIKNDLLHYLAQEKFTLDEKGTITGYFLTSNKKVTENTEICTMRNLVFCENRPHLMNMQAVTQKAYEPGMRVFSAQVNASDVVKVLSTTGQSDALELAACRLQVHKEQVQFYDQHLNLVKDRAAYFQDRNFTIHIRHHHDNEFEIVFGTDSPEQAWAKFHSLKVYESKLMSNRTKTELQYQVNEELIKTQ